MTSSDHLLIPRFLLARLQLQHVLSTYERRDMKNLKSLPLTITDAYQQIILRMDRGRKIDKTMALRALMWILKAARPLKMTELRGLVFIREGDSDISEDDLSKPTKILKVCQSFVEYDESTLIV